MITPSDTYCNIAIAVNPASGKGKAVKRGNWLTGQLTQRNIKHALFTNDWPQNFDGFTEVWIVGGDGTINYFLNHYKNFTLPFALFKGGTGDDFAWKLYGDISLADQLELVLTATAKWTDAAICNDKFFVVGLGIGFEGEVLQSMGTIRWMGGHLGYLWAVLRNIFFFKEFLFIIKSGGKEIREKFLLVIVNNSSRTGGGFMVAPDASINDGKLDMVLCKPLPVFKRLRYLPVIEKGKHLERSFIKFDLIEEVRIEAESELFAHLDGELIKSKIFVVKILPGRLLVKY